MKQYCELNKEDIEGIIAKHFKRSASNVSLRIDEVDVGYGMDEHSEYIVVAVVDTTYE